MQIRKVGLVGGGKMSSEIFKLLSDKDFDVVLWARRPEAAAELSDELLRKLKRRAAKGGDAGAAAEARLARLTVTSDLNALADADLVIESVAESLPVKREIFKRLEQVVRPDTLLTSNTSSLSPTSFTVGLEHPERCAGLHFFYPVSLVSFVEVVPCKTTLPEIVPTLAEFVSSLGKRPICLPRESVGYLVNRLLLAYYNEGSGIVGEGHWLPGEVDRAGKRFAMMGPTESIDHAGVDILMEGFASADESWGQKDAVKLETRGHHKFPPVYTALRQLGRFGIKAGVGFYRYENRQQLEDPEFFARICPELPDYHCVPRGDEALLQRRLWYSLVLEALVVKERNIGSDEDIDATLKEILGLEEAPLAFVQRVGIDAVRAETEKLEAILGPRYAPVGLLIKH